MNQAARGDEGKDGVKQTGGPRATPEAEIEKALPNDR